MLNLNEITVISPYNDGESRTIVAICHRLCVDVRISNQPWGARLHLEPPENLERLKPVVAVVEMPSSEYEDLLRSRGHELHIIDHHHYPALQLDRRQPASSLEQTAELLGYELNRREKGIAINDRDYIFGLIDAGYSQDEILEIRQFDLEAQGVSPEKFEQVREAVRNAPVTNGITILKLPFAGAGFAQDFLVMENPDQMRDLLILVGDPVDKVRFYGDPEKVAALADIGEWLGGGKRSKFWGTNNPDLAEILRRLGLNP
jgi:hypothetical protein